MARFGMKVAQGVFAVAVATALGIGAGEALATPAAPSSWGTCSHDRCGLSCEEAGRIWGRCENWQCVCFG